MYIFDWFENFINNHNRYKTRSNAVIVSCFFNPKNSPYRLIAFHKFYRSIKHLNHRIIECVIGDAKPQLPDSPYITRVYTDSLLWHKEALLNKVIKDLPKRFKYVFWVDADVKFLNQNWMIEAVEVLQKNNVCQLFKNAVHLQKDKNEPCFNVESETLRVNSNKDCEDPKVQRSFSANYVQSKERAADRVYKVHGHVGFAWGARREVLEACPLYDHALVGGADHIMAHAAAGHIPHECIRKSFTDDITAVEEWMRKFYSIVQGKIGCVDGTLYHYWHGEAEKRKYLQRIRDYTSKNKTVLEKDCNGLYVNNEGYLDEYFTNRECALDEFLDFSYYEEDFYDVMGYDLFDFIFDNTTQCEIEEEWNEQDDNECDNECDEEFS